MTTGLSADFKLAEPCKTLDVTPPASSINVDVMGFRTSAILTMEEATETLPSFKLPSTGGGGRCANAIDGRGITNWPAAHVETCAIFRALREVTHLGDLAILNKDGACSMVAMRNGKDWAFWLRMTAPHSAIAGARNERSREEKSTFQNNGEIISSYSCMYDILHSATPGRLDRSFFFLLVRSMLSRDIQTAVDFAVALLPVTQSSSPRRQCALFGGAVKSAVKMTSVGFPRGEW